MDHPRSLFVYFHSLPTIYQIKTIDFRGIRTRIARLEGEYADQLTTTTATSALHFTCIVLFDRAYCCMRFM